MTEQNPLRVNRGIIQEFVPGKQVTMAHLIANPNEDLYKSSASSARPVELLGS